MRKSNLGQTILAAIVFLIMILVFLHTVFSGRMSNELRFVKMAIDGETALHLAEGGIDEAVIYLRENANVLNSPVYSIFRSANPAKVSIDLPYSKALVQKCFPSTKTAFQTAIEIIDAQPLKNELVVSSPDRVGHLSIEVKARIGVGEKTVKVIKQFRLQDLSVPVPLNHYDFVFKQGKNAIGVVKRDDGKLALWKMPADEINTLENVWRYPMRVRNTSLELKGYPFNRQRLSYFFPTWQDMKDYLNESGDITVCGDVLSPTTLSLRLAKMKVLGFGRILSQDSNMVIEGTSFPATNTIGLGVLTGGSIRLDQGSQKDPTHLSIFLPTGKFILKGQSPLQGFALVQDLDTKPSESMIFPEPFLKQPQTRVVISGQTAVWNSTLE